MMNNYLNVGKINDEGTIPRPINSNKYKITNVLAPFHVHAEAFTRAASV